MFCVEHSTDQLSAPCPAAKLVPIGFGIRKLQITAVIEDAKVESMDSILEEELVRDGESETIQSADIAAFNKLVRCCLDVRGCALCTAVLAVETAPSAS